MTDGPTKLPYGTHGWDDATEADQDGDGRISSQPKPGRSGLQQQEVEARGGRKKVK